MTISTIPPRYQKRVGIVWIVTVVIALIVAIGRVLVR